MINLLLVIQPKLPPVQKVRRYSAVSPPSLFYCELLRPNQLFNGFQPLAKAKMIWKRKSDTYRNLFGLFFPSVRSIIVVVNVEFRSYICLPVEERIESSTTRNPAASEGNRVSLSQGRG